MLPQLCQQIPPSQSLKLTSVALELWSTNNAATSMRRATNIRMKEKMAEIRTRATFEKFNSKNLRAKKCNPQIKPRLEHGLILPEDWPGFVGPNSCPGSFSLLKNEFGAWAPFCPDKGNPLELLLFEALYGGSSNCHNYWKIFI
ncbi:hypothetical protein L3X38_044248 [Prunus dulcis]|uniref:Uncharacterized protein n=1 Tax=Prunus dulcis TaxID=3755 RepID=A0AAD4V001_PRUDU|nr:hypothetical protein L3X38_044248 [Prunus dulcis]